MTAKTKRHALKMNLRVMGVISLKIGSVTVLLQRETIPSNNIINLLSLYQGGYQTGKDNFPTIAHRGAGSRQSPAAQPR